MGTLTFGLELEWADVDRYAELPCGQWSTTDYTIVNSDGHANDPRGEEWRWGGEINTEPSEDIDGQVEQVQELAAVLCPTINYRCNLHVHVGFGPPTVSLAKRLLQYVVDWQDALYPLIEPIPRPTHAEYPDPEAYKGAQKRYRRRKVSHQHRLPLPRVAEALTAKSLEQFYNAHAPVMRGGRAWHLAPRPGMNTRSLWKHGTLELRHFPGSADPWEIHEALLWARAFATAFTDGLDPVRRFEDGAPWHFPQFRPYDHALELRYQATKYG